MGPSARKHGWLHLRFVCQLHTLLLQNICRSRRHRVKSCSNAKKSRKMRIYRLLVWRNALETNSNVESYLVPIQIGNAPTEMPNCLKRADHKKGTDELWDEKCMDYLQVEL